VGCGATGSALANLLVRAGVGRVRVADRGLHRIEQPSTPASFRRGRHRVQFAQSRSRGRASCAGINSDVAIEATVADINAGNILGFLAGATVVLDGTDNFTTRFLINDACLELALPWIYSGVIASYGMAATFIPEGAPAKLTR